MSLESPVDLRIGALGDARFEAGVYVYTGSAARGIRARVSRHLARRGPKRWHLDYLLPHVRIVHVEAHVRPGFTECELNRSGLEIPCAAPALRGFGSSDCRCPAHLLRLPPETVMPETGCGSQVRSSRGSDPGSDGRARPWS
ncbi:MAG: GIY-YIG nuclease family protein [Chthonomonadales bacterium]|nr:GIY-YIG nuclease family protein [Chthonomonadales bacterium]